MFGEIPAQTLDVTHSAKMCVGRLHVLVRAVSIPQVFKADDELVFQSR